MLSSYGRKLSRIPRYLDEQAHDYLILRAPNWALPFHIHTDALNKAIGVALGQVDETLPHAIYSIRKNLSKTELNYTVTKKELLNVVHSLKKFRHYIMLG